MPLEFIKYIDQEKKNYWIRYVVVPGYTDDEKDLKNSDSFSSDYQIFKESSSSPIIIYEKQNEENSDENILFEIKKRVLLKKFKRLKIFFLIMFKIF
jgi:pyruvate formate lyase activating enzyme